MKIAIMIFVIQLNAVKTYGPVRSIDDLVREVSKAVSESLRLSYCLVRPDFPGLLIRFIIRILRIFKFRFFIFGLIFGISVKRPKLRDPRTMVIVSSISVKMRSVFC